METKHETLTDGDVKRTHPGGRVEYFYREVDTWHTTHPGGVEVYHFPSGQTEARDVSSTRVSLCFVHRRVLSCCVCSLPTREAM